MKKCIIFIVFILLLTESQSQTLHFILVSDSIQESTLVDKRNLLQLTNDIARACNFTLKTWTFLNANDKEIENTIYSLSANNDDILWFYYVGNGSNSCADGWAKVGNICQTNIHDKLKNKGARLTITTFDCYIQSNHILNVPRRLCLSPEIVYALMFKKSKGDIKICSSSNNLLSFGSQEIGGLFTYLFYDAIMDLDLSSCNSQKQIWKNFSNTIFNHSNRFCANYNLINRNGRKEQNPIFAINIITEPIVVCSYPSYILIEEPNFTIGQFFRKNYPCYKDLTIEQLKNWNNGQEYIYSNIKENTYKINSLDQIIPKGTKIWLEEPPKSNGNDW